MLIINNLDAISENDVRRIEVCETIRKDSVAFFGEFRQRDHVADGKKKKFHFYGEKVKRRDRKRERETDDKRHTLRYK